MSCHLFPCFAILASLKTTVHIFLGQCFREIQHFCLNTCPRATSYFLEKCNHHYIIFMIQLEYMEPVLWLPSYTASCVITFFSELYPFLGPTTRPTAYKISVQLHLTIKLPFSTKPAREGLLIRASPHGKPEYRHCWNDNMHVALPVWLWLRFTVNRAA